MMRTIFLLSLLCYSFPVDAQSLLSKFSKISRPEKCWVFQHPFVAKRAFKATVRSYSITDSIKNTGTIGGDISGGKLDAFKHAYWMACVSNAIGTKKALKLGRAHEKGNWIQFKEQQLEDKILPDSVSSVMDLHNNEQGATSARLRDKTEIELKQLVLELLQRGKLACIRKDKEGNYLTCEGARIDPQQWVGKWNIPKCIIPSNEN